MNNGFILLHRSILEWEWYSDTNTKNLFIHCLLKANFEEKKWQGTLIKRGEFITSVDTLATEIRLSPQMIRTSLSKLKSTNEISVESTNKGTRITICKYDSYQDIKKHSNKRTTSAVTNEQQTDNKPSTTTNTLEEGKPLEEVYVHPLKKWIADTLPQVSTLKTQITNENCESLMLLYSKEQIKKVLGEMENKAELKKKYDSVYRTCLNWLERNNTPSNSQTPTVLQPPTIPR